MSDFLELRTGVGVLGDFVGAIAICGFCKPKGDLLDEERNLGEGQVGCHAPLQSSCIIRFLQHTSL